VSDTEIILSLGAGEQSTAMALMAFKDALPGFGQPKAAVFSDTGFEPKWVYDNVQWLMDTIGSKIPVHVVQGARPDGTPTNIRDETAKIISGDRAGPTPPLYIKPSVEYTPYPDPERQAKFERYLITRGELPRFVTMPLYAREFVGGPCAPLRRQCTKDYKLDPIYRWTRPFIGRRKGQRHTTPPFCEMWIGISSEENAKRCKPSHEKWVNNRYPLRELGMSRQDCSDWIWEHFHRRVKKSACIACPYHDDGYWRMLRDESPEEFEMACEFDDMVRHLPGVKGEAFVHSSGVPLREIDFNKSRLERRAIGRGQVLMFDGGEGVCTL
jgi:hypothetical protein